MNHRTHLVICLFLLAIWTSACRAEPTSLLGQVQPENLPVPVMQPVECGFKDPEDLESICGTIEVPQDIDSGLTEVVDLQVIIYKSQAEAPLADPVIVLGLNPGSLRFYLSRWMTSTFSEDRDVILFSRQPVSAPQEGEDDIGLTCPEMAAVNLEFLQQPRSRSEFSAEILSAYHACMQRLAESGISLEGVSARQSASDVFAIRQALGIQSFNLYGMGDTTFTALKIMELDPAAIRSVVLSSFHPPAAQADLEHSFHVALQRLLQDCAADEACNAAYPDLETKFQAAIQELDNSPLALEVQDPFSQTMTQLYIDGERFVTFVNAMLTTMDSLGTIPLLIEAAYTKDTAALPDALQNAVLFQLFLDEFNMLSAGDCREKWTDRPAIASGSTASSPIVSQSIRSKYDLDRLSCILKSQPELSPEEAQLNDIEPVNVQVLASDLPLLVVHGAYDATFSPELVEEMLRDFSQAQQVILSDGSFLIIGGRCPMDIVSQFLQDPTQEVDASCAQDIPLEFILPTQ